MKLLHFKELLAQYIKGLQAILLYKMQGLGQAFQSANFALWRAHRTWLTPLAGWIGLLGLTLPASAQTVPVALSPPRTVVPFYVSAHAMQGVYAHHLPTLSTQFVQQVNALVERTEGFCQTLQTQPMQPQPYPSQNGQKTSQSPSLAPITQVQLQAQWLQTMVAWEALSTPAVGPVVLRRSQRQIDFWPTRPELIQKALTTAPQTLADMERVGTLAKGLPAMEYLLAQKPLKKLNTATTHKLVAETADMPTAMPASTCHYLSLLVQGIAQEATELQADLSVWAAKDWVDSPEDTAAAMAEWVNQWLAGAERLHWAHLEKPIKFHQTRQPQGNRPKSTQAKHHAERETAPFARLTRAANLAAWRAQWQSLLAQARLTPAQTLSPPLPGLALLPIEALLYGKGQMALAQAWARALDQVTLQLGKLPAQAPAAAADQRQLLALAQSLKAVSALFQNKVAPALDVALGFSDADGD